MFISYTSYGTTISWVGTGIDTSWSTASNWDTNTIPVAGDDVVIPSNSSVIINGNAECRTMMLRFSSQLIIDGQLEMTGSTDKAIRVLASAILINNGIINITEISNEAIDNRGTFSNASSGIIHITEVSSSTGSGINNTSTFINQGTISISYIDGDCFKNNSNGTFQNLNTINISHCYRRGLMNFGSAIFTNDGGGRMTASDTISIYNIRIEPGSQVINKGVMDFSSPSLGGIFNMGKFENYDSLIIKNTSAQGIQNRDTIFNYTTGVIVIEKTSTSFYNDSFSNTNAYVSNEGNMSVMDGTLGLINTAKFDNHGTLNIQNMSIRGIANAETLTNYLNGSIGVLTITNMFGEGLLNGADAKLSNKGQLSIEDALGVGIKNQGLLSQEQNGTLTIGNITLDPLIIEPGAFTDILGTVIISD